MADKDKSDVGTVKNIPKDGQVITAIMKEMGIVDYDPNTIVQLNEFVYRYATSILEEARNNSKKKVLDLDDVRLALYLTTESSFTTPPPREIVLEMANVKNYSPLPLVKSHCGLRLPPDRYCLSSCNYALKSCNQKKSKPNYSNSGGGAGAAMKMSGKMNMSYMKRSAVGIPKTLPVNKPIVKVSTTLPMQPKTTLKAKVQIAPHNLQIISNTFNGSSEIDNPLKRKREDDEGEQ